jgi:hypothetical protein
MTQQMIIVLALACTAGGILSTLFALNCFFVMLREIKPDKKLVSLCLGPLALFISQLWTEQGNKARVRMLCLILLFGVCFAGAFFKFFPQPRVEPSLIMTADEAKAAQVVEGYAAQTHKWPRNSYRVELDRRDGDLLTFMVIPEEYESAWDVATRGMGGDKSFSVDVDANSLRVIRELHFQ